MPCQPQSWELHHHGCMDGCLVVCDMRYNGFIGVGIDDSISTLSGCGKDCRHNLHLYEIGSHPREYCIIYGVGEYAYQMQRDYVAVWQRKKKGNQS